jgi:hypothetical protein
MKEDQDMKVDTLTVENVNKGSSQGQGINIGTCVSLVHIVKVTQISIIFSV